MKNSAQALSFLQGIILKNLASGIEVLLFKFCAGIIDIFNLTGAAIAIKEDSSYKIHASQGTLNSRHNFEFTFSDSNTIVVLNPQSSPPDTDAYFYVPNVDRNLVLIIAPSDEALFDKADLSKAADLLEQAVSIQKNWSIVLHQYKNYKFIYEKSSNLTIILDQTGYVLEWNEAAVLMFGRELKLGPVKYSDFIHEKDVPHLNSIFMKLYQDAEHYVADLDHKRLSSDSDYKEMAYASIITHIKNQGSMKLINKNGDNSFDVEYSVHLIIDIDTLAINGSIITTSDITKKNIMQERLEESERKYRELFKLIPLFSMLIDASGKTIEFNYVSLEDYGLDQKLDGISYMDFIHVEDQKRAASLFIDLYTKAITIKNKWVKEKSCTKEECAQKLRSLRINNEPLRLVNARHDKVFETEFSASLWIGEADLEIKGSLLSAIDVTERNNYRKKLEESEKKYRELVEEKTKDIIFSLDENACFVMANSNLREKLGYPEKLVIGKNIIDILYKDPIDKNEINRETFQENLDRVLKENASDVRFKAICDHKFLGEPVTLQFKLDPITENHKVIGVMGFASEISDDPLRQYLHGENLYYEIDNRLTIADEVSFRITRNLQKYLPDGKISLLRLGVREMIVNAIEHGNLGITYEEKTLAQKNQSYHDLLHERQICEENRNKKVYIEYHLDEKKVMYSIRDEGLGFDYIKFFSLNIININEQMLQHGRGILITRSVFDTIEYNEKGNEVNLVSYLKKNRKLE